MSENKLLNVSKKVMTFWRIIRLAALIPNIIFLLLPILFDEIPYGLRIFIIVWASIDILFILVWGLVLPPYQYKRYLYLVKDDEIIIMRGLIFKESIVIPVLQIQDIGYTQGPIMQFLNLTNIIISTAGATKALTGLEKEEAIKIVDRVKENIKNIKGKLSEDK